MSQPPIDPLDYRDGALDAPERRTWIAHFIGGAVGGAIAVAIAGVSWSLSNVHYTSATQHPVWQTNQFEWIQPLSCTGICFVLFAISVWCAHRARWREFVLGSLCGMGAAMLIEGICFFKSWG